MSGQVGRNAGRRGSGDVILRVGSIKAGDLVAVQRLPGICENVGDVRAGIKGLVFRTVKVGRVL